jgi:integrase
VYLTREEIDQVGDEIDNPLHWTAFYTLYLTGMRWGEVAGLHADRLHPLRKRLDVVDVLVEVGGRREIKPYPKSKARRTLPLTDELCELLAEHLARYPARGRQLVFQPQPVGMLSRHTWGRDVFRPAVARALGRTDVRVHDLRHSYASALVQAGRPLQEVQLLLGHASITTTQRYAHLGPDRFEDAVAVLERPRRAPNVRHQSS